MKSPFLRFKSSRTPVYFGILLPLIMLLKPQVKSHIKQECVKMTAGTNDVLVEAMDKPCKLIADSLSDCLIKEAESSGKILPIVADLISRNYGDASEAVTKKCIASTLGLPKNSLDKVPLAALIDAMQKLKGDNKEQESEEAKKDQKETLEDIPESKPEIPEQESNSGDNQPKDNDSDREDKDEQGTSESKEEAAIKKEMPKFKL